VPATEVEAPIAVIVSGSGNPSGFPRETEPVVVVTLVEAVEFTRLVTGVVVPVVGNVLPTVPVIEDTVLLTVFVTDGIIPPICAFTKAKLVTSRMKNMTDILNRKSPRPCIIQDFTDSYFM